jgi:ubiquitin carboxyl-terminal hydrolase 36/42
MSEGQVCAIFQMFLLFSNFGQYGPQYTLYAVISHVGTGPNSGHYYAHVKGSDGSWYQANDEVIIKTTPTTITGRRNAYMLFYIRTPGESLDAAINLPNVVEKKNLKRKVFDDDEEVRGTMRSPSFSSLPTSYSSPTALEKHVFRPDPITTQLNEKVANQRALAAKKASQATLPLASYASSEADEELGQEEVGQPVSLSSRHQASSSPVPPPSTPPHTGDSQPGMKRKGSSSGDDDESASDRKRRRPSPLVRKPGGSLSSLGGPFRFTNNLHETRENEANFMPLQHGMRKQVIAQVGSNFKGSGLIRNMKRRYGV